MRIKKTGILRQNTFFTVPKEGEKEDRQRGLWRMSGSCSGTAAGRCRQGSFTVEASLLMPVILLVIFGVLTLFFHVHNRAWLTAAAYESALSGSIAGYTSEAGAYADAMLKSRFLTGSGFMSTDSLQTSTSVGLTVKVTYSVDTVGVLGNLRWPIKVEGEAPILRPVPWIRILKSGKEILSGG